LLEQEQPSFLTFVPENIKERATQDVTSKKTYSISNLQKSKVQKIEAEAYHIAWTNFVG
jgi:hypothetical protein